MKGDEQLITTLNTLLADELTAINQYIVHSEMCANWGYIQLHDRTEKRAIDEMRHAEKLIERLLYLEGRPVVSVLNPIHIGGDVAEQIRHDLEAESDAVRSYNAAIRLAVEVADNGTRAILESILHDEEEHIDWLEAQLDQIQQMGAPNYLAMQLED
jgi:bacterioferritin